MLVACDMKRWNKGCKQLAMLRLGVADSVEDMV